MEVNNQFVIYCTYNACGLQVTPDGSIYGAIKWYMK